MTSQMLAEGLIEPSDSPWSAPCILIKNKDGTMRFVLDYRKLNAVTKNFTFQIPTMTDIIDCIGDSGSTIFSTLDMKSGYHQIPLTESAKPKTAFSCHGNSFQFRYLSFGLKTAPSAFQRLMTNVLRNLTFRICLVYIADIIIFSKSFDEHLIHLQKFLIDFGLPDSS
jgi:hypothetical protein